MDSASAPEGIILSDFSKLCPQAIQACVSGEQWQLHTYASTGISGTMLIASENTRPAPLRLPVGLKGLHRIYVCMWPNMHSSGSKKSLIALSLTGDGYQSYMTPGNTMLSNQWQSFEKCEEFFWKQADMTGCDIILSRPEPYEGITGLLWLRFLPMQREEIAAHREELDRTDTKRLHAHADISEMAYMTRWDPCDRDYVLPESFFAAHEFARADVGLATFEVQAMDPTHFAKIVKRSDNIPEADEQAALRFDKMHRAVTDRSHALGLTVYGGYRMGLSEFMFPMLYPAIPPGLDEPFAKNKPELFCRNRDGEVVEYLSYAYPQTQEYMIANLLKIADWGYDGVSLIFTRGVHVLFEEPVLAMFRERYGDTDPRTLPFDDERLSDVLCGIMTGFLRRVRAALDDYSRGHGRSRLGINVFVCYTPQDSRQSSLDVETWAREGLIDSAVAANMRMFEDLDGVMDDADPSRIDLQKYTYKRLHAPDNLLRRRHGNDLDRMLAGCPDYMRIAREYGIKVYFEAPWENSAPPEGLVRYAEALYEKGAENISLWDSATGRVMRRADWQAARLLGHKEELRSLPHDNSGYRSIYRILRIDGRSMSTYNPSWRG